MASKNMRRAVTLALAVVAIAALPAAAALAKSPAAHASAASPAKQLKALKKQVAALTKRLTALEGNGGAAGPAGAKGAAGPAGPKGDAGAAGQKGASGAPGAPGAQGPIGPVGPSTGAAGGALTGSFPNPMLRPSSVTSETIKDGTITQADLGEESVGPLQLGLREVQGGFTKVGNEGGIDRATAECPQGAIALSANVQWRGAGGPNGEGVINPIVPPRPVFYSIQASSRTVNPNTGAQGWEVVGRNDSFAELELQVGVLCSTNAEQR